MTIPSHLLEEARELVGVPHRPDQVAPFEAATRRLAKALLAAEQFGREMEREACARIADAYAECERDCGDVIASAIRSRSEEPKP